jgi:hypothetical protein
MRIVSVLAFVVLFSSLAPAALSTNDDPLVAPSVSAQSPSVTWTVALYISADNTLSDNVQQDLDEIAQAGIADNVRVVALVDQSTNGDSRLLFFSGGAWNTKSLSAVNSSWGNELAMGSPSTLRDFASWAFSEYPSEHTALDLWGHGAGWSGVCMDRGDWLTLPELSTALAGQRLDLISIDACQMGMVEVAYQLRGCADVLVASEKDVPAEGWQYGDWLQKMSTVSTAANAGVALAQTYMSWARNHSAYSATISVIDLGAMPALGQSLDSFSHELWSSTSLLRPNILLARGATERYDGDAEYDLAHFARNVAVEGGSARLARLGAELDSAISKAITYNDAWTRLGDEPAEHANGISIWLPSNGPTAYYAELDLSIATDWNRFLGSLSESSRAPAIAINLTAEGLDVDEDGALDACSLSLATNASGSVIFELNGPAGNVSTSVPVVGGHASDALDGLPAGAYLATAYVYAPDGELLAIAEVPEVALFQSWLYVEGSVRDDDGKPISGAKVEIGWGRGFREYAMTDGEGVFSARLLYPTDFSNGTITGATDGAQTLTASAPEAVSVQFEFVVERSAVGWMPLAVAAILLYLALLVGLYGKPRNL